jgi:hypothetical protein
MNNKKCHYCGFINFVTEEVCRKCEAVLASDDQSAMTFAPPGQQYNFQNSYRRPRAKSRFPFMTVGAIAFAGIGLALVFYVIGHRKTAAVHWQDFRPRQSEMTFIMPGEPKALDEMVTPTVMGLIKHRIYESVVGGQGSVAVCVVEYPSQLPEGLPVEAILNGELEGALKRTNSTLISKRDITIGGYSGLEFEMAPPSNLTPRIEKGFGKLVQTRDHLYMFLILPMEGSTLFNERDKFLSRATFGDSKNAKL